MTMRDFNIVEQLKSFKKEKAYVWLYLKYDPLPILGTITEFDKGTIGFAEKDGGMSAIAEDAVYRWRPATEEDIK